MKQLGIALVLLGISTLFLVPAEAHSPITSCDDCEPEHLACLERGRQVYLQCIVNNINVGRPACTRFENYEDDCNFQTDRCFDTCFECEEEPVD